MANDRMPEVPATSPQEVTRRLLPAPPRPERYVSDQELVQRFTYHPPSGKARELHEVVRREFRQMALLLNETLPEGRSKSLAFTALEEASFQANAAIAREPALHDQE